MSNNTCIIITGSLLNPEVINDKPFGVIFDFHDLIDVTVGAKFPNYEVFSFADRCIGRDNLLRIIKVFTHSSFESNSDLVMTVTDDDNQDLCGIYIHPDSLEMLKTPAPRSGTLTGRYRKD